MLQEKALVLLREKSPYGEALENHCRRVAAFTLALGEVRQVDLDADLIGAACFLHDIGLCVSDPKEGNYLRRGMKFVDPYARDWGLRGERAKQFGDAMLYNHSLTQVPGISAAGELVRRAVQVEHSFGHISHGVDRARIRDVLHNFPRLNFNTVLFHFFTTTLRHGGPAKLVQAFLPVGLPGTNRTESATVPDISNQAPNRPPERCP